MENQAAEQQQAKRAAPQRVKFTLERVRLFKCPEGKAQAFMWDTDSPLGLRATKNGALSFIFEGKLDRQTIRMTVGEARTWTIESARKEARRLQTLVDRGLDPREVGRKEREAQAAEKAAREAAEKEAEAKKSHTVRALADALVRHLGTRPAAAAAASAFRVYLYTNAAIADMPASEFTSDHAVALLSPLYDAGKKRSAGIFRAYLHRMCALAMKARFDPRIPREFAEYGIKANPIAPIPTVRAAPRHRWLSEEELRAYLVAIGAGDSIADKALLVALYGGGQRMQQLLRAEVKHWDPREKTLLLFDGKGQREAPREHLLPLAPIAADAVAALVARAEGMGSKYIFSRPDGRPVESKEPYRRLAEIRAGMGEVEAFDLRDIRRTCESMLAGMGISKDHRAQLLSHGLDGVQARHYDRHSYQREKADALVRWEARLEHVRHGTSNVEPLKLAA